MGRVIPIVTVGSYKPDGFEITFRVGLIHKFFFEFQATWHTPGRWIVCAAEDLARRSRERDPRSNKAHVPL